MKPILKSADLEDHHRTADLEEVQLKIQAHGKAEWFQHGHKAKAVATARKTDCKRILEEAAPMHYSK